MLKTTPASASESESAANPAEERVEVLVKFTAQYNARAHRILADAGFAPTLHACVPVCGGVQMVVMDRVKGKMAWWAEPSRELLPRTVYEDVKSAINILHHEGLVFGDLRSPNIMCVPGGSADSDDLATADSGPRMGAMLVDFDWVGKADKAIYPAILNDNLEIWASGVERSRIWRKEHDLHLHQRKRTEYGNDHR